MKDLEGIIRACGDFVALLDEHPRGACIFLAVLLIVCIAWRWR